MSQPTRRADAVLALPCTRMAVWANDTHLQYLAFVAPTEKIRTHSTPLLDKLSEQLEAYFANPCFVFDLPYEWSGTVFQKKVWQQIAAIPSGEVWHYADLARAIHSAPRAIGQACGRNPFPVIVPCHRVVAKNGGMGGFNRAAVGDFIDIKRWLLRHEGHLF